MKKHVILFLAANPTATGVLALDVEARAIHLELKRSGHRDRFDFVTRWAAEPLDLLRELRELRPTVVHFSGHGVRVTPGPGNAACAVVQESPRTHGRDLVVEPSPIAGDPSGLSFRDPSGSARVVSAEALVHAFATAGSSVRLVVLNACFTEQIAEALLAHVDCVVGMTGSIDDGAARSFAIGFYGGLGVHESVSQAFEQGRAAIHLEGRPDADRPQLKVRAGFDATQLVLAVSDTSTRPDLPCPYPGMRPYTADDAASFHGREDEIRDLVGRLRAGEREICVIGPSGSGKSSLVLAGLLPRLARGVAGLGSFVVRDIRPGDLPVIRLSQALEAPPGQPVNIASSIAAMLAPRGPRSSLLIVVDQLEEVFTLANAMERERFFAALRDVRAERRCVVLFTLRADFFGALMESALWSERCGQLSRVEVSPLRGDLLREAIAVPAQRVDVDLEPALTERLLADAAAEPGILPLLQETLVQLWDQRTGQTLTLADYEALGDGERNGLAVALARRADATLRPFTPSQLEVARRIFVRLISFGEGRPDTRRQQPRSRLHAGADETAEFAYVLQQLVADRLLTADEGDGDGDPRIDLGHEVMITAWPALTSWIRAHRVDEQRRRQLEAAAAEWARHSCGLRGLLDPLELADAEQWLHTESARQLGHGAEIQALIEASRVEHAVRASRAREQAAAAEASAHRIRQLLAQSYAEAGRQLLLEDRAQEAMPYLLAARQHGEDGAPLRMLFAACRRRLPLIPALAHHAEVLGAAFSPDGTLVVTASWDKTARVWDAATGMPLGAPLEHHAAVLSAAFSPDGARVVTASRDSTARVWLATMGMPLGVPLEHHAAVLGAAFSPDGARVVTASADHTARVWDAVTGEPLTDPLVHRAEVWSAAFSPDGARVVTASGDSTARVWDAVTGKPLTEPLEHRGWVRSAAFSPDGTRVVTASRDNTAQMRDAATGRLLTGCLEHRGGVHRVEFSPDGARVVTASGDSTARVWSTATGVLMTGPLEHQAEVRSAAFSPDGARVVTASADRTARVWDAATGYALTSPLEHQGMVHSAVFGPGGNHIVTASDDRTARIWDSATGRLLTSRVAHRGPVWSAMFSPDGARVVTASGDRTALVADAMTGLPIIPPLVHRGAVQSAAFSPDGMCVVTASWDRTARLWSARTGDALADPLEHRGWVWSAVFSPDGRRVLTASGDNTACIWETVTGQLVVEPLVHRGGVQSAMFSPDGAYVVTAGWDNAVRIWDAVTGRSVTAPLLHRASVRSAAFSPDGTRVVSASWDQTARIWDAVSGELRIGPLEHQAAVQGAMFSPDGARVVTASRDRTARIWDAATGKPLTSPLEHQAAVQSAVFSPDGARVATASADNTARVWDATTGKPLTAPLEHLDEVLSAVFSLDGKRLITASGDRTARVWDVRIDEGTMAEWIAVAECSPFVLSGITHVRRSLGESRSSIASRGDTANTDADPDSADAMRHAYGASRSVRPGDLLR